MRRLIFAAISFGLVSVAGAETINRVAAVVNQEIITLHQLQQFLQERTGAGDLPAGAGDRERLALDQMIEETLVRQRIEELGLQVPEEEMEAAIQDVLKQNKLRRDQLEEALVQQGISFSEYRENLRQQILQYKLLGREVQNKVEVTNYEIRDYFRENIDHYREPETLRLNRLTFPLPPRATGEQLQAVRSQAEEAMSRLRQGEDFTAVLLAYSADRRAEGGDMGRFRPEEMSSAFVRAVRDLPEGGISDLVETAQAFHILQVTERNSGTVRQLEQVQDEIAGILRERKMQRRLQEWEEELRKNAVIDIRL